jgi:hypothetical protein
VLLSAGLIIEESVDVCSVFKLLIAEILLKYPRVDRFRLKMARYPAAVLIPAIVLAFARISNPRMVLNELKVLRFIGISVNKVVELG